MSSGLGLSKSAARGKYFSQSDGSFLGLAAVKGITV